MVWSGELYLFNVTVSNNKIADTQTYEVAEALQTFSFSSRSGVH